MRAREGCWESVGDRFALAVPARSRAEHFCMEMFGVGYAGCVSKRFRTCDLNQVFLLPPSLQDWLPENHLARFIAEVTNELDLSKIVAVYGRKDGRGMAAYHPAMMVRMLLYGYCRGVVSWRKIERATHEDVAFRYLAGGPTPRSRFDRQLSADAFAEFGGVVHPSFAVVRQGGLGQARACGYRWDQTEGERQQT